MTAGMFSKALARAAGIFTGLFVALLSAHAWAGDYEVCIKWEIKTVDSDFTVPNGSWNGSEDEYLGTNAGATVKARGVRVDVDSTSGSFSQTFDSGNDGCFSWTNSATEYDIRVYGYAKFGTSFIRIHDDPADLDDEEHYPGQTFSILLADATPSDGSITTYNVGDEDRKWTAMSLCGFSLYRYLPSGFSNKAIHVGLRTGTAAAQCGESSHAYSPSGTSTESWDFVSIGVQYLRLGACSVGTPDAQRKFVTVHEIGHAVAGLHAGINGNVPGYNNGKSGEACANGGSYGMRSNEWNSVNAREGIAHFYSAAVFNNRAQEGAFRWAGLSHSLERYGLGGGTGNGGRLENECCSPGEETCLDGSGTNEDWMRFFWDVYTMTACANYPNKTDMMDAFARMWDNHDVTGRNLTKDNYYTRYTQALDDLSGNWTTCVKNKVDDLGVVNGVDNI